MKNETPWRVLTVDNDTPPTRIDVWLAAQLGGTTRRQVQRLIAGGDVWQNSSEATKGHLIHSGDVLTLWRSPRPAIWTACPTPASPLSILYVDDDILAVDKPAGISSVPLDPDEGGTLAGAVVARFPECAALGHGCGDGGLIQRLDRETSGIVLAARHPIAAQRLVAAQRRGEIGKKYLALVSKRTMDLLPPCIDIPLGAAGPRARYVKRVDGGTARLTRLRTVESFAAWMLVEAGIHRGMRHQIRAHLALAGWPIAGDGVYGLAQGAPMGLTRMFLHAWTVTLMHPINGRTVTLTCRLPVELQAVLDACPR